MDEDEVIKEGLGQGWAGIRLERDQVGMGSGWDGNRVGWEQNGVGS